MKYLSSEGVEVMAKVVQIHTYPVSINDNNPGEIAIALLVFPMNRSTMAIEYAYIIENYHDLRSIQPGDSVIIYYFRDKPWKVFYKMEVFGERMFRANLRIRWLIRFTIITTIASTLLLLFLIG